MSPTRRANSLRLKDCYIVESLSSCGIILFVFSCYFWAGSEFHFNQTENMMLAAVQGFTSILSTKFGGSLVDRYGSQLVLEISSWGMALVMSITGFLSWHYSPYAIGVLYMLFVGPSWPALETHIASCKSSKSVSKRLSIYNIIWSTGNVLGLLLSGLIFRRHPGWIFYAAALLHLLQIIWINISKSIHDASYLGEDSISISDSKGSLDTKRAFAYLAWISNGLIYMMLGIFSCLMPDIAKCFDFHASEATWLCAVLHLARTITFYICLRWAKWHYAMVWSQFALWAAPASLYLMFFSRSLAMLLISLVVFGIAAGVTYSGSLYYTLDFASDRKGKNAGIHECIIGTGTLLGPLSGALLSFMGVSLNMIQWFIILLVITLNVSACIMVLAFLASGNTLKSIENIKVSTRSSFDRGIQEDGID